MQKEFALRHRLLVEASQLRDELELSRGGSARLAALREFSDTLNVSEKARTYRVTAVIGGKEITVERKAGEFSFYQHSASSPASDESSEIETQNRRACRAIIAAALAEAGHADLAPARTRRRRKPTRSELVAKAIVVLGMLCSAAAVVLRGKSTFNLIDNTYTLEVVWRMLQGEVPYRDFVLVLTPGTFVWQAALMKVFGTHAIIGVWWAAVAMALTVMLTYIALRLLEVKPLSSAIACWVAVFGGNVVLPYAWYDVDTVLLMLVSLVALLWAERRPSSLARWLLAGVLVGLPLWFKQNLGVAHIVAWLLIIHAAASDGLRRRALAVLRANGLVGTRTSSAPLHGGGGRQHLEPGRSGVLAVGHRDGLPAVRGADHVAELWLVRRSAPERISARAANLARHRHGGRIFVARHPVLDCVDAACRAVDWSAADNRPSAQATGVAAVRDCRGQFGCYRLDARLHPFESPIGLLYTFHGAFPAH
jgi:hypothetical protein